MSYNYKEKKVVAVLSSKLEVGIAFNVLGHLAISIGAYANDSILGRKTIEDATGVKHMGISKYPFIITKVKPAKLHNVIKQARLNPNIIIADYPIVMLETGHDDELALSMSQYSEDELNYLGAILYGHTEDVDIITGRFTFWK